MQDVLRVIDRLGSVGRLVVGGIAIATVAAVFYLVTSAGPASYVPAFTNLTPRQAGNVQAALASAKIPSKLGGTSDTVLVPSASVNAAVVAIDKAGLAVNGQHDGYQLLDKLSMSSTDFQQNVAMKRALEGELANEIQNIAGVSDATVNLAMPQQTLFLADQKQATASVMLTLNGGGFNDVAVRGVQRLVANAVTGLTPANVVITDQAGSLLSSSDGGIGDAAASKLATESSYSRQLESGAQQIVDTMLGPGAGLVSVNARLNLDSQTQKKITYGKTGVPLQVSSEKERLKGSGAAAAGAAGTTSNIPGYTGGTNGGSATDYTHTTGSNTNGVDQTVTDTTVAGGTPTNLYVAIAFTAPPSTPKAGSATTPTPGVPTKDQLAAAKAVQAYLGITQSQITSGVDTFQTSVSTLAAPGSTTGAAGYVPAASVSASSGGGPISMVTSHLREGAAVAGALLLLFLARRSLRRRQALLGNAEARWMPTLSAPPIPVDDIALPAGPSQGELEAANKKALQGRVEEIAGQRPNDVAQQLRGWLAEDS
ncbi:MAG: flagellar M-ring protein FliF [Gaiellales bacterium]|jgi:flagellar M-ring protein FliF|nr:flagellar M-ring protein FliF [Gaiellales bacterium]